MICMIQFIQLVFFKEKDGYSVFFPDLDGCYTCGENLADAIYMAEDVLALYCSDAYIDGRTFPPPTPINNIVLKEVARKYEIDISIECFVTLIAVNVKEYVKTILKPVRKTVTIPGWLNARASEAGLNLSESLQDALKKLLEIEE